MSEHSIIDAIKEYEDKALLYDELVNVLQQLVPLENTNRITAAIELKTHKRDRLEVIVRYFKVPLTMAKSMFQHDDWHEKALQYHLATEENEIKKYKPLKKMERYKCKVCDEIDCTNQWCEVAYREKISTEYRHERGMRELESRLERVNSNLLFYVWKCAKCKAGHIRRVNTGTKMFKSGEMQCKCPECGRRTRLTLKGLPRFTNKQDAYDYRRYVK